MVTNKPEVITLTTDRLIVRDLNYDDLDFIHVIHSKPEVQKYATLNVPESIDESKDKGYMTEAALLVMKFGFERLLLHRIEAGVATENIASIRVLEKIGMQKEGLRRKILPIRGEWKDNFHYAILEDDFLP